MTSPTDPGPTGTRPALVALDPDHPGFCDRAYRARRDAIARLALRHGEAPAPRVRYSEQEHATWRAAWARLRPLHRQHACRELLAAQERMALWTRPIPQLAEVEAILRGTTGFRIRPVAGLVAPRAFLERLADGVFLATQYVRHHARPLYTPEPDVLHELIGHAASLTLPAVAELNRRIGLAATVADDDELRLLERVYWFTMEYGAVVEDGAVRAVGAGLLSSAGEIDGFAARAELLDWDLERMARTDYDPTDLQPRLFLAPSFDALVGDTWRWVRTGCWRWKRAQTAIPGVRRPA